MVTQPCVHLLGLHAVRSYHGAVAGPPETHHLSVPEAPAGRLLLKREGGIRPGPSLWLADGRLSSSGISLRALPSGCVSVSRFPLYKDTSHTGLEPIRMTHLNLMIPVKTPSLNKVTF